MKNHNFSVSHIIDFATQKFGGEFVKEQFVDQLSYFDDVAVVPVDFINQSYAPEEIKSFLTARVEIYAKTIRPKK